MDADVHSQVVHLVDDDPAFLRAVARLLTAEGHLVQTFTSTAKFLEHRDPQGRGCVVTDLQLDEQDGLELQAALRSEPNPLPVIFLSGHGTVEVTVRAMKEGAEDFLTKMCAKADLLSAIQQALARDLELFTRRTRETALRNRYKSLTPREHEVLGHVVTGNLNKEIASKLGTSERTIKAHRAHIMEKLQVHSAAELGSIAVQVGGNSGV